MMGIWKMGYWSGKWEQRACFITKKIPEYVNVDLEDIADS